MNTDLDREFRAIADALVADAPEVPSIRARGDAVSTAPPRRTALLAVAAILAVGVAGIVVAVGRDTAAPATQTTPPTTTIAIAAPYSTQPGLYPVVADAGDDAVGELSRIESVNRPADGPSAAALIGEPDAEGNIDSAIIVRAGARLARGFPFQGAATAFGVAASVYESSETGGPAGERMVAWGPPPNFLLGDGMPFLALTGQQAGGAGADPVEFLAVADPQFATFTITNEAGSVELAIGGLPDGFEVLAGPDADSGAPAVSATLRLADQAFVTTTPFNPLLAANHVGALEATSVKGVPAWLSDDGTSVVWQVDDSTWARAHVAEPSDDPVALAESARFVDQAEWSATYRVGTAGLYDAPEFTPVTGPFVYPVTSTEG